MATLASTQTGLGESLRASGAEVLTDETSLDFYAYDIYDRRADLAAIVRPKDKDQLAAAIKTATDAGHPVVPRGGGMSYTSGYTQEQPGAVFFDLAEMTRVLEVDDVSMTATVETSCTWAALKERLAHHHLRTPMWGTLKLIPEADNHGFASFAFDDAASWFAASSAIERRGIATDCFGFDPYLNAILMKRDSLTNDAKQLVGLMKKQGGLIKTLKEGVKVVTAGRDFLKDANFSLHILTERRIAAAANADIEIAQQLVEHYGGREVENTIPKIIRANPFGPLNSILGPEGERWAPIYGLVSHGRSAACFAAFEKVFDDHSEEMDELGVHYGTLIAAVGGAGMVIEPCLYWPDARNPVIEDTIEKAHLKRLPNHKANADAWALTRTLKQAIVDIFYEHDAAHFQIGQTFCYRDSLHPRADALLKAAKAELDPKGLMNPGLLGL